MDTEREEILIHSSLAMRGPAWFWFRVETERDYIPHLKSGLKHPNSQVQNEAALALAAALQREAIKDLTKLLIQRHNVFGITEALASITDLTTDDKKQILSVYWQQWNFDESIWSGEMYLKLLSLLAKIGGVEARPKVIKKYLGIVSPRGEYQSSIVRPPLLRNAGWLWDAEDLPTLRQFVKAKEPGLQDLAIVALAQKGEEQDCKLIMSYIEASDWGLGSEDIGWLAKEAAHLFGIDHLGYLTQLVQSSNLSLQALADRVLPALCQSLDETMLLKMLTDANPAVQSCAAEGLVAIGKSNVLLEYETELLNTDYVSLIKNSAALTATGDWTTIDKLLKSQTTSVLRGAAKGLQKVKGEKTFDCLLALLQGEYDTRVHLDAANSLSIIGDEVALFKVLEWLLKHPYERSTNLMASVLVYLDRKLYCSNQWSLKRERDFSILRYSVTRDDYR
ncbi:MAG: HEAT repeat domain-containing protein [Anaerolineae bacterium]|nr:HEAT repeat domain-containing protein [Anaerolineae bacterium]